MAGKRKRSDDDSASTSLSSAHDLHDCFSEPPRWKYDVFLSFQGEGPSGTRNNFTDVLYTELCRKGIVTFKDDEELMKGRVIGDDLMKAIEDSALFLIVFSKDYASSKWCLNELVKITECSRIRGASSSLSLMEAFILPIFHDVEPKDVRKQEGSFKQSFLSHEQDDVVDEERVQTWKNAMSYVGNLSGWVTRGRKWTELACEIAELVFNKTKHLGSSLSKDLVGLDSHVHQIKTLLNKDSTCFVGICGIGGIGKTTLADAVHRQIRHCFEVSIFLPNIRETSSKAGGLMSLQERLISKLFNVESASLDKESDGVDLLQRRLPQKNVLIVLDDIDDNKQLEALAMSPNWFKRGSKVIITTRNERLLTVHEAIVYKLAALNEDDALQLFCQKAFHSDSPPPEGYTKLSYQFIYRAQGLPLALGVLGSSLYQKSVSEWQSKLSELCKIPIKEVTSTLQISYNALDEEAKKVFLHIACFFKGKSKCRVLHILSSCYGYSLDHIISLLKERSLVIESYEELWMHDLIQEMGWEVVRQESLDDPGRRSLLWHSEDIYSVLEHNTGTELVKGIVLSSRMITSRPLSAKAFSQMTKLRLLILHDISFCNSLDYLSNDLRFLEWEGFPFEYLPTSFGAKNLVELNLPNSHIKELWCKTKYFVHLKTIKLSHSINLSKTPDFTTAPNLEKLILEGCLRLQEVHKSIGILRKLTLLNLKDCEQLEVLPDSICDLQSLRFLDLSGCSSLTALPQNFGYLKCLEELNAAGAGRKRSSASWLSRFKFFAFGSSRNSRGLYVPPLSCLTSLTKINLSFCGLSDGKILDNIGLLHSLVELKLDGNLFLELPPCFVQLPMLQRVCLNQCKNLRHLPTLPLSVSEVYADDCPSLESLPNQLTTSALDWWCLSFWNCGNLARNYESSGLAKLLLENYLGSLAQTGTRNRLRSFHLCIPGNTIPTWISNQRSGGVVSVDLPYSGLQAARSGFVACCVFHHYEHQNAAMDSHGPLQTKVGGAFTCSVDCKIETDSYPGFYMPLFVERMQSGSDHIWLFHVLRKDYESPEIPFYHSKQVTFSFKGFSGNCVVVKSCGATLMSSYGEEAKPMGGCEITESD